MKINNRSVEENFIKLVNNASKVTIEENPPRMISEVTDGTITYPYDTLCHAKQDLDLIKYTYVKMIKYT